MSSDRCVGADWVDMMAYLANVAFACLPGDGEVSHRRAHAEVEYCVSDWIVGMTVGWRW